MSCSQQPGQGREQVLGVWRPVLGVGDLLHSSPVCWAMGTGNSKQILFRDQDLERRTIHINLQSESITLRLTFLTWNSFESHSARDHKSYGLRGGCRDALRTDEGAHASTHMGSTYIVHVGKLDLQGCEQGSGWRLHSHGDDFRVEDSCVPEGISKEHGCQRYRGGTEPAL